MKWGQWMTPSQRWQIGATKLGISLEEYGAHVEAGEKWCWACRSWLPATLAVFHARNYMRDGLDTQCKPCKAERRRVRLPRRRPGPLARGSASCPRHRMVRATRYGPTPEPIDVLVCWTCGRETEDSAPLKRRPA